MSSDHATVKSRSLKSIVQLLEKDPSILDRDFYVVNQILRCAADTSPLVRDSALSLLGKCLTLKPSLDSEVYERAIARTADAAIGVRKRAMKLIKDIYLRTDNEHVRTIISEALLQRVRDIDESVADLARQTFEEIWISPLQTLLAKDTTVQSKLALQQQVSLIVRTVQRGESVLSVLEPLLKGVLSNDSKNTVTNFKVCKAMVASMFDIIIDNDDRPDRPPQRHILETLTVFARANPKLFTGEQLQLLEPYIKNLSNTDDLRIYRSVIVIFRHVLHSLPSFQKAFLKTVQDALLASVSKLGKMELNEVASCLWIIDGVLKNTDRLVRLMISVLAGIYSSRDANLVDDAQKAVLGRMKRYVMIAGYFGKACDFEDHAEAFKERFPWWKGSSVAGLVVDMLCPFTRQKHPAALREIVMDSMGMLCQAWPKQFLRADVSTAFELAFQDREERLEYIVLSGFKAFFAQEEERSGTGADIPVSEGVIHGSERLGKSLVGSENDGVCTAIAQRFLPYVLRIALATTDETALTATQVIASINRQGLVHPKECGSALVALETSPNTLIAGIAFQEHRSLHEKHETMFEKEYMKAVQQAFEYQRDVVRNLHGATAQPFASKLRSLFEVLKYGKAIIRKKFLTNICSKINFELLSVGTDGNPPEQLLFARFCLENLAFFDYTRLEEIQHLVSHLEKVVTGTGTSVAHAIETEVFKIRLELGQSGQQPPNANPVIVDARVGGDRPIAPERLRQLTVASMILSMAWETRTFLRRLWNLQKQREARAKPSAKDTAKAPTRAPGVTGDKYFATITEIMTALADPEAMQARCRAFAELLQVDHELRIADDDGDVEATVVGYETPEEGDGAIVGAPPSGGSARGRKRRASGSMAGTPKKARTAEAKAERKRGRPRVSNGSNGSPAGVDAGWD